MKTMQQLMFCVPCKKKCFQEGHFCQMCGKECIAMREWQRVPTPVVKREVASAVTKVKENHPRLNGAIVARNHKSYPGKAGYAKYLKSRWWKVKREQKMKSVGWKCEECGKPAKEVHHLHYKSRGCEKNNDLQSLCYDCHRDKHPEYATILP